MFNNGNNCPKRQICEQVIEPTQTKCIEKEFYHEVPQDCPLCPLMIEKLEINEYKKIFTIFL